MNDVKYSGWLGTGLIFSVAILVIFGYYGNVEPEWRMATQAKFTAARVERGAGLYAENCTRCHGERGEGTRREGPALNTAEFLAEASDQSIADTIIDGRPNTGMPAWGLTNGGPFTDEEVKDLTAFMRAWEPTAPSATAVTTKPDAALGAALFSVTCFGCHGLSGEGTEIAPALNDREKLTQFDDAWYQQTIAEGRPAKGMPTWGKVLSPYQISDLVAFIRRWETIPVAAVPKPGGNSVDGATVFQAICVTCHGQDGAGTDRAPVLNDPATIAERDDAFYQAVISEGRLDKGMPRWGQVLSPAVINNLVALIRGWEASGEAVADTSQQEPAADTGQQESTADASQQEATADASSQESAFDSALLEQGKLIYEYTAGGVGCAYCHGMDGKGEGPSGEKAPDIRGKTGNEVKQALTNVISMDTMELSDRESEAVGAYLQYLATQP